MCRSPGETSLPGRAFSRNDGRSAGVVLQRAAGAVDRVGQSPHAYPERVDLYYHTTRRRALKIVRERKIWGDSDGFVYLSNRMASTAPLHEGTTAVHVRVPAELANLRVEYYYGENIYKAPADQVDVIEMA